MLVSSFSFIAFVAAFACIYFLTPSKHKWIVIVAGSLYFYLSLKPELPFLLLVVILFNYLFGFFIDKSKRNRLGRFLIYLGVTANLLYLAVFKYSYFVSDSLRELVEIFGFRLSPLEIYVLLPIGISFYTFQNISYLVDIYQNRYGPERHLGIFASYVLFFPKFLSGPIERPGRFIQEIKKEHNFVVDDLFYGSKKIIWAFFKKLVVADRLAIAVNSIYSNPASYSSPYLVLATIFFGFQLYADFSAYTDIAIGTSRILGYRLTENFRRPFLSRSVSEFWRRWHISLSSWFQDYVFVPLYLKVSKIKKIGKLDQKKKHLVSFIVSILIGETLLGIWHGANWTFVAFGLYYGVAISGYYLIRKKWDAMNEYLQIAISFILINIGWVFFRSNNISDALYILKSVFLSFSLNFHRANIGFDWTEMIIAIFSIAVLYIVEIAQEYRGERMSKLMNYKTVQWIFYLGLIVLLLLFGVFGQRQFIYAQF